jgi:intracellular septation protein
MKLLFDLFPVILFFAAYVATDDIYIATGVTMVATVVQVIFARIRYGKVDSMLWVSLALIVILGTLTLVLHDKRFIMWKPTVLYWILALVLLVAATFFKRNLIKFLYEKAQLSLPESVWGRLNASWVAFLLAMGVINLYVAYSFPEHIWVNFKMFGATGLTFVFFLAQGVFLSKYMEDKGPG